MRPARDPTHPGDIVELVVCRTIEAGMFLETGRGESIWVACSVIDGSMVIASVDDTEEGWSPKVLLLCRDGRLGWCWVGHLKLRD